MFTIHVAPWLGGQFKIHFAIMLCPADNVYLVALRAVLTLFTIHVPPCFKRVTF